VSDGFRLGVYYTIIRPEEKWILAAAEARGLEVERLADDTVTFGLDRPTGLPTVVLNRSVSHTSATYAAWCFEHYGIPVINPSGVLALAGDKVRTSLCLAGAGIPTPRTVVALSEESALKAIEAVGYPAVLKPAVGSWGRLMAKVDDAEEAVQILEHKTALGSPLHSVFYVQEYVPKPGRDLRTFVVGNEVVAAMYRHSSEWRTNAARGGSATPASLSPELTELSLRAAEAVGGGILAVDLMEAPSGLLVHEVNPTPEFKTLTGATGVDIASRIVDYAVGIGRR
jgi:[lysine-biosynthesis-protein LysW]---L-2-aminoadipate ligase